jgi:hypothetical protein
LKQNKELLLACSSKFCEMFGRIEQKQFSGNHSKIAKELNFALKTAPKNDKQPQANLHDQQQNAS